MEVFTCSGVMLSSQNELRAAVECFGQFFIATNFYLDLLARLAQAKCPFEHRRNTAAEPDVIRLDENAVGEVEPVVLSAATLHGIFVEEAQAGNSLARVDYLRAGALHGIHVLAHVSGDAAHALHQVEHDAFAGEDDAGVVAE